MSEQGETSNRQKVSVAKLQQTDNTSDKQPKVDKVTAVEKSESIKAVKDPRKVELGKRLAKISRETKERKARQRFKAENHAKDHFAKEITD